MTLFRTTCPVCEEVEVPSEGIVFSILEAGDGGGGPRGGYGFLCPSCGNGVWKGGRDRSGVFGLLLEAGLEPIQDAAERILRESGTPRHHGRRERRRLH
ncbi:MAG TPA: hypothetical protein VLA90_07890 [Actinomycetota bacterium]|nr:hypothetical protein [Actinomycetota bacterium]